MFYFNVFLKTNEQVQMSTEHMEMHDHLGLEMAKKCPTEPPGKVKVKCEECDKSVPEIECFAVADSLSLFYSPLHFSEYVRR